MDIKKRTLRDVEETLNGQASRRVCEKRRPGGLLERVDERIRNRPRTRSTTIYEDAVAYIKRLGDERFLRKNGSVREAPFYDYAFIDKSTWSEMKADKITPSKKTLFKLVLALQLTEKEAVDLLAKAHTSFDMNRLQDCVVLALVDLQHSPDYAGRITVDDCAEVLDFYRDNETDPFDSIYDSRTIIAERRRNERQKGH